MNNVGINANAIMRTRFVANFRIDILFESFPAEILCKLTSIYYSFHVMELINKLTLRCIQRPI